jgi:galactonate dehydratase
MLYDAMRVRGAASAYWLDALAAVDIALWDVRARALGLPLWALLGAREHEHIPVYVSGLPHATLEERVEEAVAWRQRGFCAVKFAAAVAYDGVIEEARALRQALGPGVTIVVDLHWRYGEADAFRLITALADLDVRFAEAPVAAEDVDGLRRLARRSPLPLAAGEEWRTAYEFAPRLCAGDVSIAQPEMGRTGVTEFLRIAQIARSFHASVAPHGASGVGLFLAASLHASATLRNLLLHEYQHSIVDANNGWLSEPLVAEAGAIKLPAGVGIGVEPRPELLALATDRDHHG